MDTERKNSLERMNQDTRRVVERIERDGYYREGTTTGEGGWGYLYQFVKIHRWGYYVLDINGKEIETIRARDAKAAKDAFFSLYRLGNVDFTITQKIVKTTYKIVYTSVDEVTQ